MSSPEMLEEAEAIMNIARANGTCNLRNAERMLHLIKDCLCARELAMASARSNREIIQAAKHLVHVYENEGNGVGLRAAEDRLIAAVKAAKL